MAKCEKCSKATVFGNKVSHSIRRTSRSWKPNIKRIKVVENGTSKTMNICARCLRSSKIEKVI